MSDDIILVIDPPNGRVPAKAYERIRLDLLRQGRRPKVARISDQLLPFLHEPDEEWRLIEQLAKHMGVSPYELTYTGPASDGVGCGGDQVCDHLKQVTGIDFDLVVAIICGGGGVEKEQMIVNLRELFLMDSEDIHFVAPVFS